MILDGGKKSDPLFRMCNEGALGYAGIIQGTLDYTGVIEGPFVTESLYVSNNTVCRGRKT